MSFSAEWLSLREPFDGRARNADVLDTVIAAMAKFSSLRIVDLACGTGSTYRALSRKLSVPQTWRLVDNDLSLLARAASQTPRTGDRIVTQPVDLVHDVEAALDGPTDLVTTSALLDLVSSPWLERLAIEIATRRLPFYAALTYDGRIGFSPDDPFDPAIVAAVNVHQRGDKGFGPALGPTAAAAALHRFEAVGYDVNHGNAGWIFNPEDRRIQQEMLAGWAAAAAEIRPGERTEIAAWLKRRLEIIEAGGSAIRVGHLDLYATPRG